MNGNILQEYDTAISFEFEGDWYRDMGRVGIVFLLEETKEFIETAFHSEDSQSFSNFVKKLDKTIGEVKEKKIIPATEEFKEILLRSYLISSVPLELDEAVNNFKGDLKRAINRLEEKKRERVNKKFNDINWVKVRNIKNNIINKNLQLIENLILKDLETKPEFAKDWEDVVLEKLTKLWNLMKDVKLPKSDVLDKVRLLSFIEEKKKKIKYSQILSGQLNFYKNFNVVNIGKDYNLDKFIQLSYNYFIRKRSSTISVDRTMFLWMESKKEFKNLFFDKPKDFTELGDESSEVEELIFIFPGFYYTVKHNYFFGKYLFVYTPDFETSYSVNKSLRYFKSIRFDRNSIFYMTIRELIDKIIETKSRWSLENVYIIEFEIDRKNRIVQDFSYTGIDKLRAQILADDVIREKLSKNIPTIEDKKERRYRWEDPIKHLLQGKSLYSLAYFALKNKFENYLKPPKNRITPSSIIYHIAIQYIINNFKSDRVGLIITGDVPNKIKKEAKSLLNTRQSGREIGERMGDTLSGHALKLLNAIKYGNYMAVINIMLDLFLKADFDKTKNFDRLLSIIMKVDERAYIHGIAFLEGMLDVLEKNKGG